MLVDMYISSVVIIIINRNCCQGLEERKLPLEDEDEVVGAITLIFFSVPDKMLMNNMFARLLSPTFDTVGKLVSILFSFFVLRRLLRNSIKFSLQLHIVYDLMFSPFPSEASALRLLTAYLTVLDHTSCKVLLQLDQCLSVFIFPTLPVI